MRLQTLASLGGLLWLGTGCSPSDKEARIAAIQVTQQHAKAIRDTATVAGLHTLVVQAYKREEYAQAQADLTLLGRRYPHAKVYAQLLPLRSRLDSLAMAQQQREQARQHRQSRAAYSPTKWTLAEYPDEFDKPSGHFYLTNADIQRGTFSTDASVNTPLVARLLVDSSSVIHLILYDYVPTVAHTTFTGRHHHLHLHHRHPAATTTTYTYSTSYVAMRPVKVATPAGYKVKVRRSDGHIFTLAATNALDRLTFSTTDAKTLHTCLLQGGEINFSITPDATPTTNYRFTIANADQYEAEYLGLLRR